MQKRVGTKVRRRTWRRSTLASLFCLWVVADAFTGPASLAQTPPPQPAAQTSLEPAQLEQLVAPIALYPDGLLAQVLMASTYPLEVVQAARWADSNKGVTGDKLTQAMAQQQWDASVKSLTATPSVLTMMSDKLDWTQKLGEAVLAQQPDVMDAIQRLRAKAKDTGSLKTTKEQKVNVTTQNQRDVIVIEPTAPASVYVPYYDPAVVYGPWPYPAYPPYYYPPRPGWVVGGVIATGLAFGTAAVIGNAIFDGFNWGGGNINVDVNKNVNFNRNNINVNNVKASNWQFNPEHRQGVRYQNQGLNQKFNGGRPGGADQRIDFRGRDGQQVLRPGEGGGLGNRTDIGDRPGGAGNRPDIGQRDRPNAGDGNRRPNAGDRPNAGNRDRPQAGGGGGRDRPHAGGSRPAGGGALANLGDGGGARADAARGKASLGGRSPGGGGHAALGGGGGRGGGAAVHRGGGGGGRAAVGGGGRGGGAAARGGGGRRR